MHSDFNCFAAEFGGNGGAFFIKMALFGESRHGFSFISTLWKVGNDRTVKYEKKSCAHAELTFWKLTRTNEELKDLYSSPNIVRVIKSRRMRWAGHVARMCEERGVVEGLGGET